LSWLEVSLTLSGELAEPVSDVLARHAPGGVAIEAAAPDGEAPPPGGPVVVRAYLPRDDGLEARRRAIEEGLWHLGRILPLPAPSFRTLEAEDWAETWKAHYHPIPIGARLLILPAWLEAAPGARVAVRLDPGMAFGTGTHPSTRLTLAALESRLRQGQFVADLGCGSGILSVAAALLGAGRVLALDIDPQAVEITRENAARNGVADRVCSRAGSLEALREETAGAGAPAHLLLANILAPTLIELLDQGLEQTLAPGGCAVLAGILEGQARDVEQAAARRGLRLAETLAEADWRALVLEAAPPPGGGGARER
jgi:ribosomal protein L11 methyltransferase